MVMKKPRVPPADVQWRAQQASTMPSLQQQPQPPMHQQPAQNAAANHSFWYTSPTHFAPPPQPDMTRRAPQVDFRYSPQPGRTPQPHQQRQHQQHQPQQQQQQ